MTEAKLAAQKAELCYMQTHSSVEAMVELLSDYEGKAHWLDPNKKEAE